MPVYDANGAICRIFTFKEGLLSRMAHDLELDVTRFTVEVSDDSSAVAARFDADSLRVLYAVVDGRPDRGALSPSDVEKIERSILTDVLHSDRHPSITFRSSEVRAEGDGYRLKGELSLHGRVRKVDALARKEGDRWVTEVVLHQPDFGIKPFKAALGALKIRPNVRVRLEVPMQT
jgi:hypothetical protein